MTFVDSTKFLNLNRKYWRSCVIESFQGSLSHAAPRASCWHFSLISLSLLWASDSDLKLKISIMASIERESPHCQLTRPGGFSGHSILIRSGDILGYLSRKRKFILYQESLYSNNIVQESKSESFFYCRYLIIIIIGYKFLIIPEVLLKHNGTMELWPRRTFPSLTFLFLRSALAGSLTLDIPVSQCLPSHPFTFYANIHSQLNVLQ